MDKHLKSWLSELTYVYLKFILLSMKLGCGFTVIMFFVAWLVMPLRFAFIILIGGLLWCAFWMLVAKTIIRIFKLNDIDYA